MTEKWLSLQAGLILSMVLLCAQGCTVHEASKIASDTSIKDGASQTLTKNGKTSESSAKNKPVSAEEYASFVNDVTTLAAQADQRMEDGWICNRESRSLKSGYRQVSPQVKAAFAMDYHKMVEASGQNLAMDLDSYLPFTRRLEFALQWWRKSSYKEAFQESKPNKRLIWLYESILDAGELWWRTFETRNPKLVNSAATLAHDKEQDMVFNYSEAEGKPSTFSELYHKWKNDL